MICLLSFVIFTILTFNVNGQDTNSSAYNRQYQNYEFPRNSDGRNPPNIQWTNNNMQRRNDTHLPQSKSNIFFLTERVILFFFFLYKMC